MAHTVICSPFGPLALFEKSNALAVLSWKKTQEGKATQLLQRAKHQLDAYFTGRLKKFNLPLAPYGTVFQCAVWHLMLQIPYGEVQTYADLASKLGTSPRSVGGACRANPIPIIIPCHRVIGSRGYLGGYSGNGGLKTKRRLLSLEGIDNKLFCK